MKKALTVAGSDSGGCAGIQADIKTMSACGVFAMSAITAVTCQNTLKVTDIYEIAPNIVTEQICAVYSDIGADAVKSGMLFSKEVIKGVWQGFNKYKPINYVLDPVIAATSGAKLLKDDAIEALLSCLFPLAALITPNIPEAEILSGIAIKTYNDIKKACLIIKEKTPAAVLIKGGHLSEKQSDDILYDGESFRVYKSERINTKNTHGTGCTYSAAITSYLAKGYNLYDAVDMGKKYINSCIKNSFIMDIGKGAGPVNHFFMLKDNHYDL